MSSVHSRQKFKRSADSLSARFPSCGLAARAPVSHHKFQFLPVRNQAALEGLAEKTANRFPALVAIIERPVVHIHPDEFVGQLAPHVARVLQGVLHRLGPMVEAELNARGENVGNFTARRQIEFLVNDIPAERQRQTIVFPAPPNAQVFANDQTFILIRQLAFMNDKPDLGLTGADRLKYLKKGYNDLFEVGSSLFKYIFVPFNKISKAVR